MGFIVVDDNNESRRSEMRERMRYRSNGMYRMNNRGGESLYDEGYRKGYEQAWKDHEEEMEKMGRIEKKNESMSFSQEHEPSSRYGRQ